MRHLKKNRKFGRETKQRLALMRSLANALITNGRITTTQARAKSLKVYVDKLVTTAKLSSLAARRELVSKVGTGAAKKLASEITPRFAERHGGYTRIIQLPPRVSDSSRMAMIEFVS